MAIDSARVTDQFHAQLERMRADVDPLGLSGFVVFERFNDSGDLTGYSMGHNLITQVGDQVYGERGAAVANAAAGPVGMKLGTGISVVTKIGTGAALAAYLTDSHQVFDPTFPTSSLSGTSRRIIYKVTYAAGKATTVSTITEAVLFNDALANATSPESNTIGRYLLSPNIVGKAEGDSLVGTWNHDLLGN